MGELWLADTFQPHDTNTIGKHWLGSPALGTRLLFFLHCFLCRLFCGLLYGFLYGFFLNRAKLL